MIKTVWLIPWFRRPPVLLYKTLLSLHRQTDRELSVVILTDRIKDAEILTEHFELPVIDVFWDETIVPDRHGTFQNAMLSKVQPDSSTVVVFTGSDIYFPPHLNERIRSVFRQTDGFAYCRERRDAVKLFSDEELKDLQKLRPMTRGYGTCGQIIVTRSTTAHEMGGWAEWVSLKKHWGRPFPDNEFIDRLRKRFHSERGETNAVLPPPEYILHFAHNAFGDARSVEELIN